MRRLAVLIASAILAAIPASAQQVPVKDVRAVLEASLQAMGGTNLKTIQYTAHGWNSRVGQTYTLAEDWPKYEVPSYTRVIDYDAKWSREDWTRRQGNYPTLGNLPMPETKVTNILSGDYAWDLQGDKPVPLTSLYLFGVPYADLRQLELALTPHGFLKAALAAKDATAISMSLNGASDFGLSSFGRKVTVVTFHMGKYKINGTINDQYLVELTDAWFPNPVYGDMDYEFRYTRYKNYGGVMFPGLLHVHQGDPRLNPAHNIFEYTVDDVRPNVPVATMPVPDVVKNARLDTPKVESTKLADGVWLLGGGTHNSVLVDFNDFVAVVEAPENEARSLAVMDEVARLAPNKPIKYVVNTHHHMDHAGGLRTYLAQGTTIVTHAINRQYYVDLLFSTAARTLQPDHLSTFNPMYWVSRRPPPIETVGNVGDFGGPGTGSSGSVRYVITDHERMAEVLYVEDMSYELGDRTYAQGNHSQDMLMVYLPREKILINADLYSPRAAGAPPPVSPGMLTLYQNMRKYKLDVAEHVGLHGGTSSNEDFLKLLGDKIRPGN
jgi:glyoxylase-like metal-dependent hydrolase (beta-lactamase superfamily II)